MVGGPFDRYVKYEFLYSCHIQYWDDCFCLILETGSVSKLCRFTYLFVSKGHIDKLLTESKALIYSYNEILILYVCVRQRESVCVREALIIDPPPIYTVSVHVNNSTHTHQTHTCTQFKWDIHHCWLLTFGFDLHKHFFMWKFSIVPLLNLLFILLEGIPTLTCACALRHYNDSIWRMDNRLRGQRTSGTFGLKSIYSITEKSLLTSAKCWIILMEITGSEIVTRIVIKY